MHLLPTNLAPLANLADSKLGGRFALGNVQLKLGKDNTFTASATDTKILVRVSGPCVGPVDDYPDHPAMSAAPNGKSEALIPADTWKKAFTTVAKVAKKQSASLRSVAVKLGDKTATFGATNLESFPAEQSSTGEGRFPPVDMVIKQSGRGKGKAKVRVDPLNLAEVLKTLAAVACDELDPEVEIEVNGDKPIMIRARREDGVCGDGVVMPLPFVKGKKDAEEQSEEATEASPEVAQLQAEVERLKDVILEKNREREIDAAGWRARVLELEAERNALREQLQSSVKVQSDRPTILPFQQGKSRRERLQLVGKQA